MVELLLDSAVVQVSDDYHILIAVFTLHPAAPEAHYIFVVRLRRIGAVFLGTGSYNR